MRTINLIHVEEKRDKGKSKITSEEMITKNLESLHLTKEKGLKIGLNGEKGFI